MPEEDSIMQRINLEWPAYGLVQRQVWAVLSQQKDHCPWKYSWHELKEKEEKVLLSKISLHGVRIGEKQVTRYTSIYFNINKSFL